MNTEHDLTEIDLDSEIPLDDVYFTVIYESEEKIQFNCNQHQGVFTINGDMSTMYIGYDPMCKTTKEYVDYVGSIFMERYQNNSVSYDEKIFK